MTEAYATEGYLHRYALASSFGRPTAVGPYDILHELEPGRGGPRWLALHRRSQVNYTLYGWQQPTGGFHSERHPDAAPVSQISTGRQASDREQTAIGRSVARLGRLSHPHLLIASEAFTDHEDGTWLAAPYLGSHAGLLDVVRLAEFKGGVLAVEETRRGVRHLLEAADYAHQQGVCHGPIDPSEVMVDRHGSLSIELYGLGRLVTAAREREASVDRPGWSDRDRQDHDRQDEVRSVAALAYRLLTGLPAEEPRAEVGRLVRRIDRGFAAWIEFGLDPAGGFETAAEALAALPDEPVSRPTVVVPRELSRPLAAGRRSRVGSALQWLRTVVLADETQPADR